MSSSRVPTLLRAMHTAGRRVPHPPLGGAGASGPGGSHIPPPQVTARHPNPRQPSASPSIETVPHAGAAQPPVQEEQAKTDLGAVPDAVSSSPEATRERSDGLPWVYPARVFGRNQKPIKYRPRRTVPVTLPGGYPEPPEYPPPQEYIEKIESRDFKPAAPHPLWQFFHVNFAATEPLDEQAKTPVEVGAVEQFTRDDSQFLRSWTAVELRYKTFAELHTLWYILLKERNVLYTQREERRRIRLNYRGSTSGITSRLTMVAKSMGRIKQVLQERRLAVAAAVAPHVKGVDGGRRAPFPWSDPSKTFEALEGATQYPDVRIPKVLRRLKENARAQGSAGGRAGAKSRQAEAETEAAGTAEAATDSAASRA